jgi:hypothetical protein
MGGEILAVPIAISTLLVLISVVFTLTEAQDRSWGAVAAGAITAAIFTTAVVVCLSIIGGAG